MAVSQSIYLGFDPGGAHKFGVALLDGERLIASTVSTVDDAVEWSVKICGSRQPVAAGIDTLLHWATAKSGMRPCDLHLRDRYRPVRNSVMAPNSLYGAMAIGGMALAMRLREVWSEIMLNETHPKVLLHELKVQRYNSESVATAIKQFMDRAGCTDGGIQGEHQFDAALSAWATREGLENNWEDLAEDKQGLLFPVGPVRYLWPSHKSFSP